MNKARYKKKSEILMGTLVFTIIVVVFSIGLGYVIIRPGSNASLYEQAFVKQIALTIDNADAGMEIEISLDKAYGIARKNRFYGNIVVIDNNVNKITVRLINGQGYVHYFFNDVDVIWNLDKEKKKLFLKVVEVNLEENERKNE